MTKLYVTVSQRAKLSVFQLCLRGAWVASQFRPNKVTSDLFLQTCHERNPVAVDAGAEPILVDLIVALQLKKHYSKLASSSKLAIHARICLAVAYQRSPASNGKQKDYVSGGSNGIKRSDKHTGRSAVPSEVHPNLAQQDDGKLIGAARASAAHGPCGVAQASLIFGGAKTRNLTPTTIHARWTLCHCAATCTFEHSSARLFFLSQRSTSMV